jgi:lysylphosphatidylglycerol synthetase-like protein (DUF2156 family)
VGALEERGVQTNLASWALVKDVGDSLRTQGVHLPPLAEPVLYGALVLGVAGVVLRRVWRLAPAGEGARLLPLCLLAYALVLPRLKDYSYALLLVPAALVLSASWRTRPRLSLGVLALVVGGRLAPPEAYLPLAALAGLFVLACLAVRPGAVQGDAGR